MPDLRVLEYRGGVVDNAHEIDAVVIGGQLDAVMIWGDHTRQVVPRSCIKPFFTAAVASLMQEHGHVLAEDRMALSMASHGSMPEQIAILSDWMHDIGISEPDLECGTHPPTNRDVRKRMLSEGAAITQINHNSVGKHIALIELCKRLSLDHAGYNTPGHPVQAALRQRYNALFGGLHRAAAFEARCRDASPIPLLTVTELARLGMAFSLAPVPERYRTCVADVRRIMWHRLALLSRSPDYFLTRIATAFGGRFLAKEGSNGVCFFAFPNRSVAGAFKVRSGAEHIAPVVLMALLDRLGYLDNIQRDRLRDISHPIERGSVDQALGKVVVDFDGAQGP